jgi:hypothetical protein
MLLPLRRVMILRPLPPTGVMLTAGCFYCNPKSHVHGPAAAHEETVVIEI